MNAADCACRRRARPRGMLCAVLVVTAMSSCAAQRGDLEVELVPPIASRFFVHGNCFAGWYIAVDLVIREMNGVDVILDSVSLRVEDERTGKVLGERMADAAFLREQFGELGAVEGSIDAPATSGSIVVSGTVLAHDEQARVSTSFRIVAAVTVEDRGLPTTGACP